MADDTIDSPAPEPAAAPVRAVQDWAARKGTPALWLRAACAGQRWTDTRRTIVDEATYDAAVLAAMTSESR